jgi:hypothetical protein
MCNVHGGWAIDSGVGLVVMQGGETPLHLSGMHNTVEVAKVLITSGADTNLRTTEVCLFVCVCVCCVMLCSVVCVSSIEVRGGAKGQGAL